MRAPPSTGTPVFTLLVAMLAGCTTHDGGVAGAPAVKAATTPIAGDHKEVLAPIDSAEILVRESFPPQYALRVVSGLPSGCARFSRVEVERNQRVFNVTVWNTVPADGSIACTMIYGTAENTAELGGEFDSGATYEVRINGEPKVSFKAQ